ncbi:MAG: oligopeptide/dipeptide ABC transporter ATP-binding protein [Candidatus Njordarchaeota archaeon]
MLLNIRDLHVSYRISKYLVGHLKEHDFVDEISRYISFAEGVSDLVTFDKILEEKIGALVSEEVKKYRSLGMMNLYALNGVNLDIDEGTILACVGESGCGKTTLAHAILGVLPENASVQGSIVFEEKNLVDIDKKEFTLLRARKMGYIGQGSYTYLNPMFTNAFQVLESAMLATNNSLDEAYNNFIKAARHAQLDSRLLLSYPRKLSGGEIRRVAFAMALSKNPRLLICDEPFRNLDVYMAKSLANVLREIIGKFETTAIIFTHNLALMAEFADEIAVMYQGTIVERGKTIDIFKNPYHPYTKGLIGAIPDPRKPKKRLIYVPGEPLPRIVKISFCPFFNRCPIASEECIRNRPSLKNFDGRLVACHNIEEIYNLSPIEFWEPYIE